MFERYIRFNKSFIESDQAVSLQYYGLNQLRPIIRKIRNILKNLDQSLLFRGLEIKKLLYLAIKIN